MRSFFFVLFICGYSFMEAQLVNLDYDSRDLQRFISSKTIVVSTGNQKVDDIMISAFTDHWTITDFKFLDKWDTADLQNLVMDEDYSFFLLIKQINFSYTSKDVSEDMAFYLFNGDEHQIDLGHLSGADQITKIIEDTAFDKTLEDMCFKLPYQIKLINDELEWIFANKIKLAAKHNVVEQADIFFSGKAAQLKDKTLLIPQEYYEARYYSMRAIKENAFKKYPYKFEVMPQQEIMKIVSDEDKAAQYCVLIPVIKFGKAYSEKKRAQYAGIYNLKDDACIYYDLLPGSSYTGISKKSMKNVCRKVDNKNYRY